MGKSSGLKMGSQNVHMGPRAKGSQNTSFWGGRRGENGRKYHHFRPFLDILRPGEPNTGQGSQNRTKWLKMAKIAQNRGIWLPRPAFFWVPRTTKMGEKTTISGPPGRVYTAICHKRSGSLVSGFLPAHRPGAAAVDTVAGTGTGRWSPGMVWLA